MNQGKSWVLKLFFAILLATAIMYIDACGSGGSSVGISTGSGDVSGSAQ